jgi:ATP-dependent protease ClpP protease subunit
MDVKLFGIIGGDEDGCIKVDDIMAAWPVAAPEVTLLIDSPGGSVFDGFRLADHIQHMRNKGQKVSAKIVGECYSIATVVACACNEIAANCYAMLMIHSPTISLEDAAADDLRKGADMADKISDSIADVYANKTGMDKITLLGLMKNTTFLSAKEAQDMKLIDKVYAAIGEIKNKWSAYKFVACAGTADAA